MTYSLSLPLLLSLAALALIVGGLVGAGIVQIRALRSQSTAAESLAIAREKIAGLDAAVEVSRDELNHLRAEFAVREKLLEDAREGASTYRSQLAALKTELDQQRRQSDEKIQMLQDARRQLTTEFENLANRIFDEKSKRFTESNQQSLVGTLNPLREQLTEFKRKVEEVYDKESRERVSLATELGQLKALNQQMSEDAHNLTRALKGDNKVQGNWGEVVLERLLEESGLTRGREYETQVSLQSAHGGRRAPDVIIRLPEQRDIIIDAKVSLVHYESYCKSEDDDERRRALKMHAASVREHIKGLSVKEYENLAGVRTLDFVFIFIPIEAAFLAAFEQDQAMFRDAFDKNVVVVSPTTLLATLRTVQSIWRYENQNKNAEEIARQAGAMHDKFVGFIEDLEKIGDHLQRAHDVKDKALEKLSSGRGNLVRSAVRLAELGAKTKKTLPASVADNSEFTD